MQHPWICRPSICFANVCNGSNPTFNFLSGLEYHCFLFFFHPTLPQYNPPPPAAAAIQLLLSKYNGSFLLLKGTKFFWWLHPGVTPPPPNCLLNLQLGISNETLEFGFHQLTFRCASTTQLNGVMGWFPIVLDTALLSASHCPHRSRT